MFKAKQPDKQRFTPLEDLIGEPLTVADLSQIDDLLVALAFRADKRLVICRWGWKRFVDEKGNPVEYQGFWTLDNSPLPPLRWDTYGTLWQAYRVTLPQDVGLIAVVEPEPVNVFDPFHSLMGWG